MLAVPCTITPLFSNGFSGSLISTVKHTFGFVLMFLIFLELEWLKTKISLVSPLKRKNIGVMCTRFSWSVVQKYAKWLSFKRPEISGGSSFTLIFDHFKVIVLNGLLSSTQFFPRLSPPVFCS